MHLSPKTTDASLQTEKELRSYAGSTEPRPRGGAHDGPRLLPRVIVRARRRPQCRRQRPADRPMPGGRRPALLSTSEVLTLAILAQVPRFRSERAFWRFAHFHLRRYFPNL